MKRIVLAVFVALVTFSSCKKQEPIDYSGPVTLYRVGEASFGIPAKESDTSFFLYKKPSEYLFGVWFKGDVVTPTEVIFANPYYLGDLGYTKAIESGKILYLGEEEDNSLFRFEDLTFKVTRRDESGITDTYQIRGIAKSIKQ